MAMASCSQRSFMGFSFTSILVKWLLGYKQSFQKKKPLNSSLYSYVCACRKKNIETHAGAVRLFDILFIIKWDFFLIFHHWKVTNILLFLSFFSLSDQIFFKKMEGPMPRDCSLQEYTVINYICVYYNQKRRRSRVRDTAAAGVVDTSRKTWPSLTDEGRTLTLEGPTHPARRWQMRGRLDFGRRRGAGQPRKSAKTPDFTRVSHRWCGQAWG